MKYLLDASMARVVEMFTIDKMQVPSMVLMERAALGVATKTAELAFRFQKNPRIAAVCGVGNNGADAIAAARILSWQGLPVDIILVGDEKKGTGELEQQIQIAMNSGLSFARKDSISQYDILIDGLFGIGLNRNVENEYYEVIKSMNESQKLIVSVDIPSGIHCTTGQILKIAVEATATVTFGYLKQGLMLYPGRELAGEITVEDIGLCPEGIRSLNPPMYFTYEDIRRLPARKASANKGTYGRCLVIAGSEDMSGAAYLSGAAAYKTGVGITSIFTHEQNAQLLRKLLVEAIVIGYQPDQVLEKLEKAMEQMDYIILGPGLSLSDTSREIVNYVMTNAKVPVIIDADALNILANQISLLAKRQNTVIVTPHIGEMERLTKIPKARIKADPVRVAREFADTFRVICVLKDATTVVAEPMGRTYLNTSGTPAMAKAGSGDVLTGILAGMLALKLEPFSAAAMGVYLHGLAGEEASEAKGEHSVMATDLIEAIGVVLKNEK